MAKKTDGKVKAPAEHWGEAPDGHDYPAASDYLSLICPSAVVKRIVQGLKTAPLQHYKAKDLLRASALELLPMENAHVASDLAKVKRGTPLSPVLLVRGDIGKGVALTIADGYHRVCASYHLDENADIPCHLVDLVPPRPAAAGPASPKGPTTVQ